MRLRYKTALVPLVAAFAMLGATAASSDDTSGQAASAGAKICAAASKDFPLNEAISVATLKARLAELGVPLDGHNLEELDSSCSMAGMMSGFGALPVLHLGTNNRQDVAMTLKVDSRNGECVAVIASLDGC